MLSAVKRRRIPLPERGVEIAVLDWGGSGPLALLHHANGFCASVWGPVADALKGTFRVVAMDARGHGSSSKPKGDEWYNPEVFMQDLAAVAATLVDESPGGRIALGLGHSLGGAALIAAAAEHPDLFERLVLADPVIPSVEASPEIEEMRVRLMRGARARRHVWPSREVLRESWSQRKPFASWDPRVLDLYLSEGFRDRLDGQVELQCAGTVEARVYQSHAGFDVSALAERVKVPTLVLWARRGDYPRRVYEDLVARMSDGRVQDADTSHFVVMEDPSLVAREALAFYASTG